jgi:D-sedoheptulose 7-phosphate isomerase
MKNIINELFSQQIQTLIGLADTSVEIIENFVNKLSQCLLSDGKIFIYGHGASAANALHFFHAMTHKYSVERPALPCICLNHFLQPAELITDNLVSRQLSSLASKNDMLILLATNSNNPTIIKILNTAHQKQINSILLHGSAETSINQYLQTNDLQISIPNNNNAALVREIHLFILHLFCDLIEKTLFNQIYTTE